VAEFDPIAAIGMLCVASEGYRVVGTCTSFKRAEMALTVAHCVADIDPGDLWIAKLERGGQMRSTVKVDTHPTADLAALHLFPDEADHVSDVPADAFWGTVGNYTLGEEFMTYGYPLEAREAMGPFKAVESARLLRGNFQRFHQFADPGGHQFLAGEMSVPAPTGMSGAPLFRPGALPMLTGLVVGSTESSVLAYKVTEVKDGVETYLERVDRVTTYGVALMLAPFSGWLDGQLPAKSEAD
jgi:hypothetical protein